MGRTDVLHLLGPILVGPQQIRPQAWVIGGRITFKRPTGPGLDMQSVAGFVLPGLVDAHCHIGLDAQGAVDAATARRQAETDRDAGALLLRDAGSPADTRWLDHEPDLPRLIRAGRHLARPGRYLRNFAHEIEPSRLVEYVRLQAQTGDGWVKLVGDWIDRGRGELAPCWPLPTLAAAVAAAHAEGARVTAHCFGEEALPDLLAAGIDGIEHACGLTAATIAAAAAAQVAVVPTLVNIATFEQLAQRGEVKFPRWAAQMRHLHARRYDTVAHAAEAGVPIYCGTDAGGSLPHGLVAAEVAELVRAGLSPVAAVDAACWGARRWLGEPGLSEGEPADLVVYGHDPRLDVRALAAPACTILGRTWAGFSASRD